MSESAAGHVGAERDMSPTDSVFTEILTQAASEATRPESLIER